MAMLDVVRMTTMMTNATRATECNHPTNEVDAHLHGAAPRSPAAPAVQQHVHPVPRHRLHRLLAKLHLERRQPPRHRPLCASPASPE